jgi:CheY-like chemotaxis protein
VSEPATRCKRILVVEDEPGYRELMQFILGGVYNMTICSSVEEALVNLDAEQYDLVIADINLHGMTGFAVLEKVKELGRLKASPVIMCSSQFDEETKDRAMRIGAAGFIPKPYQNELVVSTVEAFLGATS